MIFADRLKQIRAETGLSQEAIGAQGFVTMPGWIKLENSQRAASEKLIDSLVNWLVRDKYIPAGNREALRDELLTLKYLDGSGKSPFLQKLAANHASDTPAGQRLLAAFNASKSSPRLPAPGSRGVSNARNLDPPGPRGGGRRRAAKRPTGAAAVSPRKGGN